MGLSTYNGHSGAKRERVQAHLTKMWASGEWPAPAVCLACDQTEGALHGHLEDYDRPETYVSLCITCHLLLHCRFRNREVWDAYRARVRAGWQAPPLVQRSAFGVLLGGILRDTWPVGAVVSEAREQTWLDVGLTHP